MIAGAGILRTGFFGFAYGEVKPMTIRSQRPSEMLATGATFLFVGVATVFGLIAPHLPGVVMQNMMAWWCVVVGIFGFLQVLPLRDPAAYRTPAGAAAGAAVDSKDMRSSWIGFIVASVMVVLYAIVYFWFLTRWPNFYYGWMIVAGTWCGTLIDITAASVMKKISELP